MNGIDTNDVAIDLSSKIQNVREYKADSLGSRGSGNNISGKNYGDPNRESELAEVNRKIAAADTSKIENAGKIEPGSTSGKTGIDLPKLTLSESKHTKNSLLRKSGMPFMNGKDVEFSVVKLMPGGNYNNYLEFNSTPELQNVVSVDLKGNYLVGQILGENDFSLGVKYHSLIAKNEQFKREAEFFLKLVKAGDERADIFGLSVVTDGSDVTKINGINGFYGLSTPKFNAGFELDMRLKEGISKLLAGIDFAVNEKLMISGLAEKKFANSFQLSSEKFTVMANYQGKTFAFGGLIGFEHVSQKMSDHVPVYIWAPNAEMNGNNLFAELYFAQKMNKNIIIKPFLMFESFKSQPYGERPNYLGFGVTIEINFDSNDKLGYGQGHSGRDGTNQSHSNKEEQRLSTRELAKTANETYAKMQIAKKMMAAQLGAQGAHGYPKKNKATPLPETAKR